jgi:hypothetical protein
MTADVVQIAQNVARNAGWQVFPCAENKAPAIGKADGGRGCLDATTDPALIARMFSHRNAVLIGVATGERSGFDVLDVDVKHAAARAWMIAAQSKIPPTRTYQTRSGGFHLLFRHAEGVHNTESQIGKGIDTRGSGGYIVLWFSAGYLCTDHSSVAEWPGWLLESLFYKPEPEPITRSARPFTSDGSSAQRIISGTLRKLAGAPDGRRHKSLRAASCTLGGLLDAAGMSRATAADLLLDAILQAGGERVDRTNAKGTIDWGLAKGALSPLGAT